MEPLAEQFALNMQEELGRGAFAVVYGGRRLSDNDQVAAKVMQKPTLSARDRSEKMATIKREIEIMQKLQHDDVVQLVGKFEDSRQCIIVMEKVPGGELFDFLSADESIKESVARGFVQQLLDVLVYIHRLSIMHLDIKPENLLLNAAKTRLKVIDFGLAHFYVPSSKLCKMIGTPEFVAPEICQFDPITPAVDVWAAGVVAYIVLTGYSPFLGDTDADTLSNASAGEADFDDEDIVGNLSPPSLRFLEYCLEKSSRKRPTAEQCLNHEWFTAYQLEEELQDKSLPTKQLRKTIVRRRWKNTARALNIARYLRSATRALSVGSLPLSSYSGSVASVGNPRTHSSTSMPPGDGGDDARVGESAVMLKRRSEDSSHDQTLNTVDESEGTTGGSVEGNE